MHALTALATLPTAARSLGVLSAVVVAVAVSIIGIVIIRPSAEGVLG